jgi:hypothetical protein
MKSFKFFLLKEYYDQSVENEAMIILQKIIDMVDDGHIDYSEKSVKINIGKLIKDKKYSKLNLYIVKGSDKDVKIGKHKTDDHHTIFVYAHAIPKREDIDKFLLNKEQTTNFKSVFKKFFDNTVFDEHGEDEASEYEKTHEINTRESFEKLYSEMIAKLEDTHSDYQTAKSDIDKQSDEVGDDLGRKEVFSMSLAKLKSEFLGGSESDFKKKAIEQFGLENYKLLNPEYKTKLESRIKDYFESKVS